jgi:prepilin-type processing-associated H-X9-DG protein
MRLLYTYMGKPTNGPRLQQSIFYCPTFNIATNNSGYVYAGFATSYLFNAYLMTDQQSRGYPSSWSSKFFYRLEQIQKPSRVLVLTEGYHNVRGDLYDRDQTADGQYVWYLHSDAANVLFVDGHVNSQRATAQGLDVYYVTDPGRPWLYDVPTH